MYTQIPLQEYKIDDQFQIEQKIREYQSQIEQLKTELESKYSKEDLLKKQKYYDLSSQLEKYEMQINTCENDIAKARQKGHPLGELYREKHNCEEKLQYIRNEMSQYQPAVNDNPQILSDNQSILTNNIVGRKRSSELEVIERRPIFRQENN